tara:strand:- start:984 stop:1193 length:210 start_codon:yes stop_codon:yes gene_type:complete
MTDITLEVVQSINNKSSYHVKLLLNGEDCGMLYLSHAELEALDRLFLTGAGTTGDRYMGIKDLDEQYED